MYQRLIRKKRTNDYRFSAYWGTTDGAYRQKVAARYYAVATECSKSPSGGLTSTHCADIYGDCATDVLAYTRPAENLIVNCPLYFGLPEVSNVCHAQDRATTTIHELTHAELVYQNAAVYILMGGRAVFLPSTDDNCYGYDSCVGLTPEVKINTADMYAIYANAIYSNC
jgi:deuterolysin